MDSMCSSKHSKNTFKIESSMVLVIDFRFAALTCKVSGGTAVFDA